MRKKSHLLLARQLINFWNPPVPFRIRAAFCFGSILPDLKPSFFMKRHEMDGTIHHMEHMIATLPDRKQGVGYGLPLYYLRLGEVMHYVADYFTYPHNKDFSGTMREHCIYEGKLKHELERHFVSENEAGSEILKQYPLRNTVYEKGEMWKRKKSKEITNFIKLIHKIYMESEKHTVELDCRYIVKVCSVVCFWIMYD